MDSFRLFMPFLSISNHQVLSESLVQTSWVEFEKRETMSWKKNRFQTNAKCNSMRLLILFMEKRENDRKRQCVHRGFNSYKHLSNSFSYLQEHSNVRSTPLAMLAAQCNKLSNKSPPPLADAAIGKGFHPWKKNTSSPPLGEHSPPLGCNINSNEQQQQHRNLCVTTGSIGNLTARWAYSMLQ